MSEDQNAQRTVYPGIERVILALDTDEADHALDTVDAFGSEIGIFKVGLQLFTSAGPGIVERIHERGKEVFLDLKFHDIPNTVASAALEAAKLGVFMFNVHASGGAEMMRSAADAVVNLCLKHNLRRPRMLAVTVLTSMGPEVLKGEIGVQHGVETQVRNLARLAKRSGCDGVVASAREARIVKDQCGPEFLCVTPGIRPKWAARDDQERIVTPRDAMRAGADYIVVGRAVMKHSNPSVAMDRLKAELEALNAPPHP